MSRTPFATAGSSTRCLLQNYFTTHCTSKNGAQGRIRTFVATSAADLQSAAINHSATCAHPACLACNPALPAQLTAASCALGCSRQIDAGGHCMAGTSRYNQTFAPLRALRPLRTFLCRWAKFWSWRRDLNPRPPDYKSGALPAELRQRPDSKLRRNTAQRSLNFTTANGARNAHLATTRAQSPNAPSPSCPAAPSHNSN